MLKKQYIYIYIYLKISLVLQEPTNNNANDKAAARHLKPGLYQHRDDRRAAHKKYISQPLKQDNAP